MSEGTKTPFRRDLQGQRAARAHRRARLLSPRTRQAQLERRNAKAPSSPPTSAVVAFTAPDGPAVLKLGRKDDATSVRPDGEKSGRGRQSRHPAEAGPGQGSVRQHQRRRRRPSPSTTSRSSVAAGAGTKAPDGPTLDLAPGKYKYSIKLPGKPAQTDEIELGADEIWGLMIGPGGVLALQAY